MLQDLRYALRALIRSPGLSAAAIITFALGVGANATTFGLVDRLFFQSPAHVRDPSRVVRVYVRRTSTLVGTYTSGVGSYVRYADLRDAVRGFASLAAYHDTRTSLGRGAEAEPIRAGVVTASFFPLLGVQPEFGRFFTPSEDDVGAAARVAVLGHEFWLRRFGGDSTVLGRALRLGKNDYVVIGVAPRGFTGVDLAPMDLWLPMSAADPDLGNWDLLKCTHCFWLDVVGRLQADEPEARVETEATVVFRRPHPDRPGDDSAATVLLGPIQAARGPDPSRDSKLALWLTAVSGIVLLIACANVANLLLARALQRRREVAVRLALGAGRGRLVRQLLTESGLIAALGAAAALLVIGWSGPVLRAYLLPQHAAGSSLDLRTLAFTATIAVLTGLLAGLAPALQAAVPDLTGALKSGEGEARRRRSLTRAGLVVSQIALTLVLLAGAGLFIASLRNVQSLRLGFDPDRVLKVSLNFAGLGLQRADIDALYEQVHERLTHLPGVGSASLSVGDPLGWSFAIGLWVPGRDSLPRTSEGGPYFTAATPDYFGTLGTAVRRGRGFTAADVAGAPPVAVVGETMARLIWPGENPLGKCLIIGSRDKATCTQVVGVVEDARRNQLIEDATMQYFVPLAQAEKLTSSPVTAMLVRTEGPADAMIAPVRRAIQEASRDLPYADVSSLATRLEPQLRPWRLGAALFSLFGALGLLLAAVGLYGVLAYLVSQRTHEVGIRMALGAESRDVLQLIIGHGLRVAVLGVAIGAVTALATGRVLASLLYGVSPHEPLVLVAAGVTLLVVAALSSWLPARRATKVDPMVALRYE
ncbi:MAG TPA: ABC transporter permease [Gemmatimonadales bacterium]|jgi:predicted permease|nr:ABC transporter permease [Gemmatimonadales bacterium]